MAESTALEALTAELLGDVGLLHDDVKALRELLPGVADGVSEKLLATSDKIGEGLMVQGGNYLAAAGKLAEVLKSMSEEIDRTAAEAAKAAAESAKLDVRQAAIEAAGGAIRDTVGAEVREVVGFINEAAANLVQETERTRTEISKAARLVSWRFGRVLGAVVFGGILGGLVAVLGVHYVPVAGQVSAQGVPLSSADRQAVENGNKIQKVWNNLTPKERDHINELLREAQ